MTQFARFFGNLRNPLRYPEFMEYGMAGAGLLQTVIAWSIIDELAVRRGLAWTIFIAPPLWSSLGLALCAAHIFGLWVPNRQDGRAVRLAAAHASLIFWMHFVGTITAKTLFDEQMATPLLLAAAMVAPYSAFVVCVRLWKEWQ